MKFAFRQLLKNPGFTAVAVLTLALGIGASTAIVSVVRTALFVALWEHNSLTLEGGHFPTPLYGLRATRDFFKMFSVAPLLGRLPGLDDAAAGAEPVVVLGHSVWRSVFGGDPSVVGRSVRFKEETATVIGVMPSHFSFPTTYTGYWRPWPGPDVQAGEIVRFGRSGSLPNTGVITELREGNSPARAQAYLDVIQARQVQEDGRMAMFRLDALDLRERFAKPELRRTLWALTAATVLVLLIASANLANLQLALRSALGAGRWRVFRQLLGESLLLALLGGLAGLSVTAFGLELLRKLLPPELPRLKAVALDQDVLGITLLVTMATAILFRVLPAWRGGRLNVSATLKLGAGTATAGPPSAWFTRGLVVGQISLTLVLLCGAGLMVRTVNKLLSVDVGFDPRGLVCPESKPSGLRKAEGRVPLKRRRPGKSGGAGKRVRRTTPLARSDGGQGDDAFRSRACVGRAHGCPLCRSEARLRARTQGRRGGIRGAARCVDAFLFGVPAHDPLTLFAVLGVLGLTALLACWLPARRAAKVDPIEALRYE